MTYEELSIQGYAFARLYEEVSSTMDIAREVIPELQGGHGVVCARRQIAGRGRQGRTWSSAEGALMATFLMETSLPVSSLAGYSLLIGVGLVECLRGLGAETQLKWPNDLVVVNRDQVNKIGGILIEVQDLHDRRIMLVGIGINLSGVPSEVPAALSVRNCVGRELHVDAVLPLVAQSLLKSHIKFSESGGFSNLKPLWEEASCFEPGNTKVTIDLGKRSVSGVYQGVDDHGSLLLSCNGEVLALPSGHITGLSDLRGASN